MEMMSCPQSCFKNEKKRKIYKCTRIDEVVWYIRWACSRRMWQNQSCQTEWYVVFHSFDLSIYYLISLSLSISSLWLYIIKIHIAFDDSDFLTIWLLMLIEYQKEIKYYRRPRKKNRNWKESITHNWHEHL